MNQVQTPCPTCGHCPICGSIRIPSNTYPQHWYEECRG